MSEAEFYAKKFMEVLKSKSTNQEDPVEEWTTHTKRILKDSNCICTKEIQNCFNIQNKITGEICVVGCDCVMRWLDPKLECEDCGEPLGNKKTRLAKQDFKCRSCKLANKKWLERRANFTLHYPGPWKGKTFKVVAENESWAESLLLSPRW